MGVVFSFSWQSLFKFGAMPFITFFCGRCVGVEKVGTVESDLTLVLGQLDWVK